MRSKFLLSYSGPSRGFQVAKSLFQSALSGLLLIALGSAVRSTAQTRQFLDAPVVRAEIQVRLAGDKKTMQWQVDGRDAFRSFPADALFLTKTSVYITYPMMNPLRVQATASATAADDPAYATITKLISTITSVATTVGPTPAKQGGGQGAGPQVPTTCAKASEDENVLYTYLYGSGTSTSEIKSSINGWIDKIDEGFSNGESGPKAITDGVQAIRVWANQFKKDHVDTANEEWKRIGDCAKTASDDQKGLYQGLLFSAGTRIDQLSALLAAANALADLLSTKYAGTDIWIGNNNRDLEISGEIIPTFDKMQSVTVKASNVTLKVDESTDMLTTQQESAGSAAFNVRRYSSFAPEIGVGAVFGTIKQPKYGTSTNTTGQTVVARVPDTSLSISPTILVNFVCRCETGLLVPMLQIGASASKDLPSLLIGGGLRLFGLGKGDVSIGGGTAFAWVKDLQKLKVGDLVTGTKDIDADLGYVGTPKIGGYFAIQYKF